MSFYVNTFNPNAAPDEQAYQLAYSKWVNSPDGFHAMLEKAFRMPDEEVQRRTRPNRRERILARRNRF